MKKSLSIIFLLCTSYIYAQDTINVACSEIQNDKIFTIVEEMPQFPKGKEMLDKFITDNLRYPHAQDKSADTLKGDYRVYVTFVIAKDGSVCGPKIIRGVRKDLDEEALRVVKLMPKWLSGKQNGKPVNVQYNLPIRFHVE